MIHVNMHIYTLIYVVVPQEIYICIRVGICVHIYACVYAYIRIYVCMTGQDESGGGSCLRDAMSGSGGRNIVTVTHTHPHKQGEGSLFKTQHNTHTLLHVHDHHPPLLLLALLLLLPRAHCGGEAGARSLS